MNAMDTTRKPITAVCAALGLAAFATWIYQQFQGLSVTGMSNISSWGLYIACFMFFIGLSAGTLIIASAASVFGIEKLRGAVLPSVVISTVSLCLAGLFILVDLGSPQGIWHMVASLHITSPLAWDMIAITCCLVVEIFFLKSLRDNDVRGIEIISRIALVVAILVLTIDAWTFGLQIGREGWNSAIMGPLFIASALDSGIALIILSLLATGAHKGEKDEHGPIPFLAGVMATCIAIDCYMIICEIVTASYPGTDALENVVMVMLAGQTAPFFWTELILGIIVPFCILLFAKNRENYKLVAISSVLVLAGVFCKRIWLLLTSFAIPNVAGTPGISLGTTTAQQGGMLDAWATAGSYAPSVPEVIVAVGITALGILAFVVLTGKFSSE